MQTMPVTHYKSKEQMDSSYMHITQKETVRVSLPSQCDPPTHTVSPFSVPSPFLCRMCLGSTSCPPPSPPAVIHHQVLCHQPSAALRTEVHCILATWLAQSSDLPGPPSPCWPVRLTGVSLPLPEPSNPSDIPGFVPGLLLSPRQITPPFFTVHLSAHCAAPWQVWVCAVALTQVPTQLLGLLPLQNLL